MAPFPERVVDLAPHRLIAWLRRDDARGAGRQLDWQASREVIEDGGLGPVDVDADDGLTAWTTIGLIEVVPRDGRHRWTLRLRIEDVLGSHLGEDGAVPDGPEPLDLDGFEATFLPANDLDEDPPADLTLEAVDAAARRHFERLVAEAYRGGPDEDV
jgi:hypothetical protein